MPALFTFEVHTPYRLFFSDSVEAVITSLSDGEIGIYADHSPFTAPVRTGILKIKDKAGQWKEAFTTEGILEVNGKKTVLLVEAAEWPDEIDYNRALAAKQGAEEILKTRILKFETINALAKLKRAKTRLMVYSRGPGRTAAEEGP
jgi:F-type H+-transporting ATPase subunit epsilon